MERLAGSVFSSKSIVCAKPIPQELKDADRWCLWKFIDRGGKKPDKLPITPTGEPAKCNDASTWGSFQHVHKSYRKKACPGHGLNFATGDGFAVLDLDDAVLENGLNEPHVECALRRFENTYCEYSPSGRGIHVWMRIEGDAPNIADTEHGFEIYSGKHFMSVTGNALIHNTGLAVVEYSLITDVYQEFFAGTLPEEHDRSKSTPQPRGHEEDVDELTARVRRAVSALSDRRAEGYHSWFQTLCALYDSSERGVECAEELWHEFSQRSRKYDQEQCQDKWDNHSQPATGPITVASLFKWAEDDAGKVTIKTPEPKAGSKLTLDVAAAADIKPERVDWLWHGRLPRGKLAVIQGDPGDGKSFVVADLAARISRGTEWPDGSPCKPGRVLLINSEDDPADTTVPRLIGAEADLDHIEVCTGLIDEDGDHSSLSLVRHMAVIESAIQERPDLSLLVIDPLGHYLTGLKLRDADDMYSALPPLNRLAARYSTSIAVVIHQNKATAQQAKFRGIGSTVILGSARALFMVCRDPRDQDNRRRLFLPVKSTSGPEDGLGMGFSIVNGDGDIGRVAWIQDAVDLTADQAQAMLAQRMTAKKQKQLSPEEEEARLLERVSGEFDGIVTPRQLMLDVSRKRWPTSDEAFAYLNSLLQKGLGEWEEIPAGPEGGRPSRGFRVVVSTPMTQNTKPMSRLIFDIETNHKKLDQITRIWCISCLNTETGELLEFGPRSIFDGLRCLSRAKQLIGHNCLDYDLPALERLYAFRASGEVLDTLLLSRLVFNGLSDEPDAHGRHDLRAWGRRLGTLKGDWDQFSEWHPDMQAYCSQDCRTTLTLLDHLRRMKPKASAVRLECEYATYLKQIERHGFTLDVEGCKRLDAKLGRRLDRLQGLLDREFPPKVEATNKPEWYSYKPSSDELFEAHEFPQLPTKTALNRWRVDSKIKPADVALVTGPLKTKTRRFNANSNAEVIKALRSRGWEPVRTNASGSIHTGEDTLWNCGFSEGRLIAAYRGYSKLRSFAKQWLSYEQAGKIYPRFVSNLTATGRSAAKAPNIQQIPKDKKRDSGMNVLRRYGKLCRQLFKPHAGYVLVGCDLAGIEVRLLGHRLAPYDEGKFAAAVTSGDDIHQQNADAIGITRDQAKTTLYGSMYGQGAASLSRRLKISKDEARSILDGFTSKLEGFAEYKRDLLHELGTTQRIALIDGRRIQVKGEHKAINYSISADAAILMKHWVLAASRELAGTSYRCLAVVHDEIQSECRPGDVEQVKQTLERTASECGEQLGFRVRVDASASHGGSWAETH